MRARIIAAGAAIAFLVACSGDPEPIIIAGEGSDSPSGLAPLDSAAESAPAATLEEVTPAEEQPRETGREAPPAEVARSTPEPKPRPRATSETRDNPEPAADPVPVDSAAAEPPAPEPAPTRPAEPTPPATADTAAAETVGADTAAVGPADDAGVLPAGTRIHAALDDSLSSRRDSAGKVVTARVMQHVTDRAGNRFIPAGAVVQLTVTRLEPAKSRSAADGKLELRVDGIRMGGELRKIEAKVEVVPHELKGRGITGSEAGKVGAGAAAGAVAGRVIGGNTKGAVIGAAAGAAAGAAVAAQTADRDVVVKARTPIVLVLQSPLVAIDSR